MTDAEIIAAIDRKGHLNFPYGEPNPHGESKPGPTYPTTLKDKRVVLGVESFQAKYQDILGPLVAKHHPRRLMAAVRLDGDPGPATQELLLDTDCCGRPDYEADMLPELAAVGSGNWPRCWDVGNFHAAKVKWDLSGLPDWLKADFNTVWKWVYDACAAVGLKLIRDDTAVNPNIDLSWVNTNEGWIGLAQVVNGATCGARNWGKFNRAYRAALKTIAVLILHELGHLFGMGHSTGIMRSYIDTSIEPTWIGDASEGLVKQRFGGVAIPGEPEPPEPGPGPTPPPADKLWFKGTVEAMDGNTSRGKYIIVPASES